MREAVKEMREGEKKRDEWAKNVGKQVDEMVKSLPSVSRGGFQLRSRNRLRFRFVLTVSRRAAPRQASIRSDIFP